MFVARYRSLYIIFPTDGAASVHIRRTPSSVSFTIRRQTTQSSCIFPNSICFHLRYNNGMVRVIEP